jgi:hypothetical protein
MAGIFRALFETDFGQKNNSSDSSIDETSPTYPEEIFST